MSAAVMYVGVLDLLEMIPTIDVYTDTVPDDIPADSAGRVYPYAVLWTEAGTRPVESRALEVEQSDDLRWTAPVTVASGDPVWTLRAVDLVRATLDGQMLTPRSSPLEEDPTVLDVPILKDHDVTPTRHYVPLRFVTTTG